MAVHLFGTMYFVYVAASYSKTEGFHKYASATKWFSAVDFGLTTAGSFYFGGKGFEWRN